MQTIYIDQTKYYITSVSHICLALVEIQYITSHFSPTDHLYEFINLYSLSIIDANCIKPSVYSILHGIAGQK